jgi:ubiquinone/menaquinone biosynthesis C-methylase UbiE
LTALDSNEYKEAERQSWNSVAPPWQKWWKTIERGTEKVSRRLIELAEIKPGSRVLDIATGTGDHTIPPDAERMFAKQMNATTISLASSHASLVSHPNEIAKYLVFTNLL